MKDAKPKSRPTGSNSLTMSQKMCQALEDDIVSGRLLPGQQLEELMLVERFKCSRTPVREALHLLCATELVERRPNLGVFIATLTPARMLEIFEAMAEMEALCGRLCVERMTGPERRKLTELHLKMREVVHQGDAETYIKLNSEFHCCIYGGVKNSSLVEFSQQARRRITSYRRVQFKDIRRLAASHSEHDDFVQAVDTGNAKRGSEVLYNHIMSVKEVAMDYLEHVNRAGQTDDVAKCDPLSLNQQNTKSSDGG